VNSCLFVWISGSPTGDRNRVGTEAPRPQCRSHPLLNAKTWRSFPRAARTTEGACLAPSPESRQLVETVIRPQVRRVHIHNATFSWKKCQNFCRACQNAYLLGGHVVNSKIFPALEKINQPRPLRKYSSTKTLPAIVAVGIVSHWEVGAIIGVIIVDIR